METKVDKIKNKTATTFFSYKILFLDEIIKQGMSWFPSFLYSYNYCVCVIEKLTDNSDRKYI